MKIIYFVTEDSYFLSHRLPVAIQAKNEGYEVIVVTNVTDRASDIEKYGFKLIPLNINRSIGSTFSDLLLLFKLIKIIRAVKPDIIHNVAIKPIIIGSISSFFYLRVPVVNAFTGMGFLFTSKLTFKYVLLKAIVNFILKRILQFNNIHALVQNDGDSKFIKDSFSIENYRLHYIGGSGVDTDYFSPTKSNKKGLVRVITTSRMLKDKGVLDFYEAALILKKRGVPCICTFVGGIDEKNPSSISSSRVSNWKSEKIIEYYDQVPDVRDLLSKSHIFVLASYREGLSKSLLEAAAFGLPLVATDIAASKKIVINEGNGLLVPVKNAFALANAIERLVLNNDLRGQYGKMSRNIALREFSEEVVNKKTLELYNSLLV